MNLKQMFQEYQIAMETPQGAMPTCGDFYAALLSTIRRINLEVEKPNEIIILASDESGELDVIGSAETYLIPEEPYVIGDVAHYETLGITLDTDNNFLVIPETWTKLLAIFVGGTKYRSVPYDTLKVEGYETDYCNLHRNVYFNQAVETAIATGMAFKVRRDYELPAIHDTEYTAMPDSAYQLLLTGCVLSSMMRHKYFNPNLVSMYKPLYDKLTYDFGMQNMTRAKHHRTAPRFHWDSNFN